MSAAPVVSVVLPTFNRANVLKRAIDSVLSQSYDALELIVVDDASSDETGDVLAAVTEPELRVIRLPENRGPAGARNAGVAAARGTLVAFQDSDDAWLPGSLAALAQRFLGAPSSVAVSYGRMRKILGGNRTMSFPGRFQQSLEGELFVPLSRGNFVDLPAAMVRREAFEAVGRFDERLRCLEDWELFLRLAKAHRFAFVDQVVVESPLSEDGVNDSASEALRTLDVIQDRHGPAFDSLARANLLYMRADALIRLGQGARARGHLIEALIRNPRHTKSWFAFAASIGGKSRYVRMKSTAARMRHGG